MLCSSYQVPRCAAAIWLVPDVIEHRDHSLDVVDDEVTERLLMGKPISWEHHLPFHLHTSNDSENLQIEHSLFQRLPFYKFQIALRISQLLSFMQGPVQILDTDDCNIKAIVTGMADKREKADVAHLLTLALTVKTVEATESPPVSMSFTTLVMWNRTRLVTWNTVSLELQRKF